MCDPVMSKAETLQSHISVAKMVKCVLHITLLWGSGGGGLCWLKWSGGKVKCENIIYHLKWVHFLRVKGDLRQLELGPLGSTH